MRHHHEEGRGPRGRHGDPSEHGDHGRRGGGRRQRFFGHGELRLIILDILSRSASHGYELIKEIETLTQGNYSPSPGVIYPTLDLLQDQGLISVEDDNGRKKIVISEDGKQLPFGEAQPGATGLELLLPLTLRWAQECGVPLATALARITCDPAAVLGIEAGTLAAGSRADICVFDPEARWCVTPDTLRSQGKNTPFPGEEMCGQVRATLVGGRLVFGDAG